MGPFRWASLDRPLPAVAERRMTGRYRSLKDNQTEVGEKNAIHIVNIAAGDNLTTLTIPIAEGPTSLPKAAQHRPSGTQHLRRMAKQHRGLRPRSFIMLRISLGLFLLIGLTISCTDPPPSERATSNKSIKEEPTDNPPKSTIGSTADDTLKPHTLLLKVGKDGAVSLRETSVSDYQAVPVPMLADSLAKRMLLLPDPSLFILAKGTEHQTLEALIEQVKAAGVDRFELVNLGE